jgi:hypothetical protein
MKKQLVFGMMIVLAMAVGVQAAIVSPIAYYPFNDGAANAFAGGTPFEVLGGAYFSSERYITSGGSFYKSSWNGLGMTSAVDEISGTNDWTISFWMDPMGMSNYHPVVSTGDPDGRFMMINTDGNFSLYYTGYGNYPNNSWANMWDQWRFFAFTANSTDGTFKMYSGMYGDTALTTYVSHAIQSGESLNAGNELVLGARNSAGGDGGSTLFFDELAIWDQGLSESQLMDVFNQGKAGQMLVPEPATLVLLGMATLAGLMRKKH